MITCKSIAHWLYVYYGDIKVVSDHYEGVKRYADSLTARAVANDPNHTLLNTGGWGDW